MKKLIILVVMFMIVHTLASCGGGASVEQTSDEAENVPEEQASNDEESAESAGESVTLRIMDSFTDEGPNAAIEKLNQMFMEQNPNITIEREAMRSDDMRTIVQTTLSNNEGPDVIYYDTGPGFAGVLAKANLIQPIDDLYEQYNWDERILPWTKARTTFDDQVYGIGNELEFYGAYYNKNLFDQLGLSIPQSYEELLEICQVAQDNGLVAISFGDQGKWPAYHTFSITANNVLGKEKMEEILFGDGRWDDPEVVQAIDIWFEEMKQAGCFVPDTTAVSFEDGALLFYNEMALMHFTGTWFLQTVLESSQSFDVGWLFFPSVDGKPVLPPAGLGSGYFISANSQNVDAAGRYLDFLFSEETTQTWMEDAGFILPIDIDSSQYELSELFKFAVESLAQQEMGYNIDVLTPDNFNTVMGDGFQAVLLGEKTPEQQAADLQAAWEQAIEEGKIER